MKSIVQIPLLDLAPHLRLGRPLRPLLDLALHLRRLVRHRRLPLNRLHPRRLVRHLRLPRDLVHHLRLVRHLQTVLLPPLRDRPRPPLLPGLLLGGRWAVSLWVLQSEWVLMPLKE